MSNQTIEALTDTLSVDTREQVLQVHSLLTERGFIPEIKEAKSGFTVSYTSGKPKKTLAVFVQRKTGVKLRIYPRHLPRLIPFLQTLPQEMKRELHRASVCKRLINPDACNPKCQMGYEYILDGETLQKCRHMAFMPAITPGTTPYILEFLKQETKFSD